jgi:DNA alkylation damage repair protein AlkB
MQMSQPSTQSFDLCPGQREPVKTKTTATEGHKKRKVGEPSNETAVAQHLRPGMVLLKRFVKPEEQIEIVRTCRELGVGLGGFYRPSFKNGAKMNLWLMSLGKNRDPTTRSYDSRRPFDGAKAPEIPKTFKTIAQTAISMAKEFPQINPDICIVNYYTNSGKLGLHQDKDESESSLNQGLPFISISIGDTAEFLFGDTRDKDKAAKVNLESGDVLILGEESRLLFHGISHVKPDTTPTWLREETGLRPGRVNLTLRQY